MIRMTVCAALLVTANTASAQTFATSEQPGGVSTSISTGQRVERAYSAVQPAKSSELEQVYSVPTYQAYDASEYDASAYSAATQPIQPLPAAPAEAGRAYGEPVDVTPTDTVSIGDDLSQPLGSPQTFASASPQAGEAEIGFAQETETSRLLLALEDTFAKRTAELKVKHLAQRKALLDAFEKDAANPEKVIGLAKRMRTALGELDAVHKAALQVEQSQYSAAMLSVLDRAPSRAE